MDIRSYDVTQLIGQDLGGTTVLKLLGRGAMGAVFVAFQKSLKRQVAVKVLPKSVATTELSRSQFLDEAETIAALSHPYIIPIFEMGETTDVYYQVMQLVQGSDLNNIIRNHLKHPVPSQRLIPIGTTISLIVSVLEGLSYAHAEGVIHQDMKPANILIEQKTRRPLIADFGIARTAQAEYKAQGLIVGTPLYLAPEQASAQATDARADIYSMGVILFEMLAGAIPVNQETAKQLLIRKVRNPSTVYTRRPSECSPIVNAEMERIILKAVAPRREDRYQSCSEFIADLHGFRDKFVQRKPA